jgi:hypothetical protein
MSSAAIMIWTALVELALLPFALRERMRIAQQLRQEKRRGQRNAWQKGAR